jgi:hypothetical protein
MDDANRRRHIFRNPRHRLDALVQHFAGEEAAAEAMADAVNAAFRAGTLSVDYRGYYKQAFGIGGIFVVISGRVANGVVRIATAWIPA